jgi:hypothetical protein
LGHSREEQKTSKALEDLEETHHREEGGVEPSPVKKPSPLTLSFSLELFGKRKTRPSNKLFLNVGTLKKWVIKIRKKCSLIKYLLSKM